MSYFHSLAYKSISVGKKWDHIRFETQQDFKSLEKLVSNNIYFGVEKKRPSRRDNYVSALHVNDTCHTFTFEEKRNVFKTRFPLTMGIDLLFSENDGLKVWVRYSSLRAQVTLKSMHF